MTLVSLLLIVTGGLVNGWAVLLSVVDVAWVLLMEGALAAHARTGMENKNATSKSRKRPRFAKPSDLFNGSITVSNSHEIFTRRSIN